LFNNITGVQILQAQIKKGRSQKRIGVIRLVFTELVSIYMLHIILMEE